MTKYVTSKLKGPLTKGLFDGPFLKKGIYD